MERRLHDTDCREGLQLVFAAERVGRRIKYDSVARLDAAKRRRLAVRDLHEPVASTEPNVLGRSDGNPVLAHGMPGKKARAVAIKIATNVSPKSHLGAVSRRERPTRPANGSAVSRSIVSTEGPKVRIHLPPAESHTNSII